MVGRATSLLMNQYDRPRAHYQMPATGQADEATCQVAPHGSAGTAVVETIQNFIPHLGFAERACLQTR